jgi:hypothetical protein
MGRNRDFQVQGNPTLFSACSAEKAKHDLLGKQQKLETDLNLLNNYSSICQPLVSQS